MTLHVACWLCRYPVPRALPRRCSRCGRRLGVRRVRPKRAAVESRQTRGAT